MLLVYQTGSVKIGEVIRYTLTYTPSADRILPSPSHLHVKIKNTAAIPLRAAYLHGPYTLHVAAYPSTFNPNDKLDNPKRDGVPEFEPFLKAGGHWSAKLTVPEDIRETGNSSSWQFSSDGGAKSVTWIIEIASQILFSTSATVGYELLVGRDSRSLELGFAAVAGRGHGESGQVRDQQQGKRRLDGHHAAQPKGIYSKAVELVVEDTESLWNKPALPEWKNQKEKADQDIRKKLDGKHSRGRSHDAETDDVPPAEDEDKPKIDAKTKQGRKKKIHLVMLTHGMHSNVGADMLYLKESIDATAKQAREDARRRRKQGSAEPERDQKPSDSSLGETTESQAPSTAALTGGQEEIDEDENDEDDEQIIVRGFSGNVVRTERGIQYLGKRLAKYIFYLTYPDQPFLPIKKSMTRTFSCKTDSGDAGGPLVHSGSSVHETGGKPADLAYTFTSISFIGHSLGGLVQTYAVAYIQKHSPTFFEQIKPVNFVAMASPLLGLSNENPVYVKFALDFGLVGRTGQDLGLTWRAPTIARHGWTAMVGGLGAAGHKDHKQEDPRAKPLLRILPTGPAHQVLKQFRNRTVYSNVVNDGIVPLRTSCLLFLDWRGLGKVEKARRENGLIGTFAGWGWAELTGANHSSHSLRAEESENDEDSNEMHPSRKTLGDTVPQPAISATSDDMASQASKEPGRHQFVNQQHGRRMSQGENSNADQTKQSLVNQPSNPLLSLLSIFRPKSSNNLQQSNKTNRAYTRGQTLKSESESADEREHGAGPDQANAQRPRVSRGDSVVDNSNSGLRPPKTTVFEAAGDLLNPPLPPIPWLIDPSTRPRTIFHDRVYHPDDIPPPPIKKRPSKLARSLSGDLANRTRSDHENTQAQNSSDSSGNMKVEEKIARAYHRDMSWRKVLVRLEPDAHNNIIVRRMFANAYGWPVIKHLCDTHFADTYTATTRDEDEPCDERAKGTNEAVGEEGEEVEYQRDKKLPPRSESEVREARDELTDLKSRSSRKGDLGGTSHINTLKWEDSVEWDDKYFEGTEDEDTEDEDQRGPIQRLLYPAPPPHGKKHSPSYQPSSKLLNEPVGTSTATSRSVPPQSRPFEAHRVLGPTFDDGQRASNTTDPETVEPIRIDVGGDNEPAVRSPRTPGGMTELGLRKSVEEQVVSPSQVQQWRSRRRSGSQGLAEQVARLSMTASNDRV